MLWRDEAGIEARNNLGVAGRNVGIIWAGRESIFEEWIMASKGCSKCLHNRRATWEAQGQLPARLQTGRRACMVLGMHGFGHEHSSQDLVPDPWPVRLKPSIPWLMTVTLSIDESSCICMTASILTYEQICTREADGDLNGRRRQRFGWSPVTYTDVSLR